MDDIRKLRESHNEFLGLVEEVVGSGIELSFSETLPEKSKFYVTLVEELAESLQQIIVSLCESEELPIPSSLPRNSSPSVEMENQVLEAYVEAQLEILIKPTEEGFAVPGQDASQ